MVLYSQTAEDDFFNIIIGLATWDKHPLGYDHAMKYVEDIRCEADAIDKKSYHINSIRPLHLLYGKKIHTYRRNRQTNWYIIYNWNASYRLALVTKIINNYLTFDN